MVILKKPPWLVVNTNPNWSEKPMATFFYMVQNFTQSALMEIQPGPKTEAGSGSPLILGLGLHGRLKKRKLRGKTYFIKQKR